MNMSEVRVKNFLQAAVRGEVELPPSVLEEFVNDCRDSLVKQFSRDPEWYLRMSGIGRPLCQQIKSKEGAPEETSYNMVLRFLIGDLVEAAVMAIMKSAGIDIVESQGKCQLEIGGENVKGTLDVVLNDSDGHKVWDIKSASPYSYSQKFGKGYDGLKQDDPFGYVMQGHLYAESKELPFGGWIVVDKSSGEIQFVDAPEDQQEDREVYLKEADETVQKLMSGFQFKRPPMQPEEEKYRLNGEDKVTGNKLLNKNCTFCGYRAVCWPKAELHPKVTSRAKIKPLVWYHTLKVKEL